MSDHKGAPITMCNLCAKCFISVVFLTFIASAANWVSIWGPRSLIETFSQFGSLLGLYFMLKVSIFFKLIKTTLNLGKYFKIIRVN